jgi:hypothetical protein
MILKNIFAKKSAKKLAFLILNTAGFCKSGTLVFKNNANYFRRKLVKIAENCRHNIDPRSMQHDDSSPIF